MGEKLDTRVGSIAERINRRMTRRNALRTAVLGGAAGIASLALGQSPALAVTCDCGPTYRCGHYGYPCPNTGCPSGYSLCKNSSTAYCSCDQGHYNRQGYCCEYSSGQWVACSGLGHGYGYELCYDCLGPGHCADWCTCLSTCICCQCLTPQDVRQEHKRLQAQTAH